MGKTYRYSQEDGYEGHPQDWRVPQSDIAEAHKLEARTLHRHLPRAKFPLPLAEIKGVEHPVIRPGWVPSRIAGRTALELIMRDERLAIIEQISKEVLHLAANSS